MIKNNWYKEELVNNLYPEAIIIPPQKIGQFPGTRGITLEHICTNGEYFAQIKKDGYCYIYNKTDNHSYLFSRNVSRSTGLPSEKSKNVPHIIKFLDKIFPKNTVVIGEIYYPNGTSKDVTSIMGCLPKKAIDRQEKNPIHFYIHDIIMYDGASLLDVGALERFEILSNHFNLIAEEYEVIPSFIELPVIYKDCNLLNLAAEALANGEEGIVLKKKGGEYYPGLRPAWETIKIKKTDTIDVVCMGFEDATKDYTGKETSNYWIIEKKEQLGKEVIWREYKRGIGQLQYIKSIDFRTIEVTKPYYNNWKTAINIGLYKNGKLINIGSVASGLTDFYREEFSKNPDKYIGKVIECKFMEKGEGTLRHPIFVRFREDKNSEECLYEEIF